MHSPAPPRGAPRLEPLADVSLEGVNVEGTSDPPSPTRGVSVESESESPTPTRSVSADVVPSPPCGPPSSKPPSFRASRVEAEPAVPVVATLQARPLSFERLKRLEDEQKVIRDEQRRLSAELSAQRALQGRGVGGGVSPGMDHGEPVGGQPVVVLEDEGPPTQMMRWLQDEMAANASFSRSSRRPSRDDISERMERVRRSPRNSRDDVVVESLVEGEPVAGEHHKPRQMEVHFEVNTTPPQSVPIPATAKRAAAANKSVFAWEGVSYSVGKKGHQAKTILSDIDGFVAGGELCALLGPSGAGKTSLLNILAGRIRTKPNKSQVSGAVLLDGQPATGAALRHRIAYVMQEDSLLATATPREALLFRANLRMPRSVSTEEKEAMCETMLTELGLTKCADTLIGNPAQLIRGISGGEKKRVSIGVELIVQPKLVFLDEPTSGLDSFAAQGVVARLRELAHTSGCNVLCTIHQPSSEIFHTFDKLLLLESGRVAYSGPLPMLSRCLAAAGRCCPNEFNLADHALCLLQTLERAELDDLIANHLLDEKMLKVEAKARRKESEWSVRYKAGSMHRSTFLEQLRALVIREFRDVSRAKISLVIQLAFAAILTFIYSAVFWQVGDVNSPNYNARSHFGGFTFLAVSGMFGGAQPLLFKFPLDRPIFLREYATGCYGTVPYFISKSIVELPQWFAVSLLTLLIGYFMMGLQGSFMALTFAYWLNGLAASSTGLLLGCAAANPEVAAGASGGIFVPQILFSGFYIPIDQIPEALRWMQYICSLKWGMNLFLLIEFGSDTRTESWPPEAEAEAVRIIDQNNVTDGDAWAYTLILVGLIIGFRSWAMILLVRKAAAFY